ncbi:MAG: TlpA family protein disulfide reductase [Candidatus Omnitrophica bacterium]|nr:TlpA family protein disulfide reductase [Candidatus Omnitrophota bacterium]MCF7877313.1 TlpA family protein disulfide reductase [Candidatus Omnitrophota bacterium]MCF7878303.1 TlpA family protein disulfide reductase [Candidatus Omnitrophota bacterium]MCF7892768.1 TlpA family protein disulfide reductase [Candidatus Omnitrophota bacterium]
MVLLSINLASAKADSLFDLERNPVSYQEIIASPQTILFVWTSWCPYCRRQLKKASQYCSDQNIEIILVNSGEKRSVVEGFAENQEFSECMNKSIILDRESMIARKFSVLGFPTFIFLKNGKYLTRSHYLNQDLIDKIY